MNQLKVSLSAINANYQLLKSQLGGSLCAAVVKANAYGLGIKPIAESLFNSGCNTFFVAILEEAVQLRSILPDARIYVFHGPGVNEAGHFENYKLIPVINNKDQLMNWPREKPCAVHFDTGMTRLGFSKHDMGMLNQTNIKLVMSHLASADQPKTAQNYNQLIEFQEIAKQFPNVPKSFCNSYGIFLGKEFHYQLARPGIGLYGGNPTPETGKNPMKPVVSITSQILQVTHVTEKRWVGYGATASVKQGDVVATIPCGYADGYLRNLSNHGMVYIGSNAFPVIGRVSMDLITVKITKLPEYLQKVGTPVEILGSNYTICDMARDSGTIEYEVITRLGNRFKRVYE